MDFSQVDQPDVISIDSDDDSDEVKVEQVVDSIEVDQIEYTPPVDSRNGEGSAAALRNGNYGEYYNLELELSPLEQSAPRRYIRIALAMPWVFHMAFEDQQQQEVLDRVGDAFFKTIQRWPFLGGSFRQSETDVGKLQLKYPEDLDMRDLDTMVRMRFIDMWDCLRLPDLYQLETSSFGRNRFRWGSAPVPERFMPVLARVSFARGSVIVGFSFSEVIFDRESIRNFLDTFIQSTYGGHDNTSLAQDRTLPVGQTDQANLSLFPCFDWSGCDPERKTPQHALRSKVFTIDIHKVRALYRVVQETIYQNETEGVALYEDCFLALFWVSIMRARFHNGRFRLEEKAHVFYSVPGAENTRLPQTLDLDHCGNTTITAVATCEAMNLIRPPATHEQELRQQIHIETVALAAQVLRKTLRGFTGTHLSHLVALKRLMDPIHTNTAHERALRRHTDCLAFEDWSCFGTDQAANIPYAQRHKHYFFPCYDDLQEGTVIILPRTNEYYGDKNWNVCVCLAQDDMELLIENLQRDKWWSPSLRQ
ncbi:hypothetical protein B0J13DRAFT_619703 [Dactylonectria estremocensis]|uniref:Uncharacterized protein n=1 Tax=Dactylonectria estremocensis TaxID=1079267 RepID=A0A9P9F3G0_9HYPO|nr:hypothetical protein B0J13DRAFT_619703 [Dactylonectria estremocensis]